MSSPALYRPPVHNQFVHIIHLAVIWGLVIGISLFSVSYALGYKINLAAHSITSTAIISLSSAQPKDGIEVDIDGQKQSSGLPFRLTYILPGEYQVSVHKNGYQSWNRLITIAPNQTVNFNSIILVFQNPQSVTLPDSLPLLLPSVPPLPDGIAIHQKNELWIEDNFVTRTSEDILAAQWFPDSQHVVYQAGSTIWLSDLDGLATEKIVTLPTSDPTLFTFQNGGQTFLYQQNNILKALQLY